MPIIFEHYEAKCADWPVGRVAGNDIDLAAAQRTIEQAEIHRARRPCEAQSVGGRQSGEAIRPRFEFVPDAELPGGREFDDVGDRSYSQPAGILAPHDHGESVFEAQPTGCLYVVPLLIDPGDCVEYGGGVTRAHGGERLLEDRSQRRTRVLDVPVNAPAHEGLLAEVAPGEIEPALHTFARYGFDLLRDQFAEYHLLGKVFSTDDDAMRTRRRARADPAAKQK